MFWGKFQGSQLAGKILNQVRYTIGTSSNQNMIFRKLVRGSRIEGKYLISINNRPPLVVLAQVGVPQRTKNMELVKGNASK